MSAKNEGLFAPLHFYETAIVAVFFYQIFVLPSLNNPALVHHADKVGVADSAQPVRNHQRSTLFHQPLKCLLYLLLALGVEGGSRLV